MDANLNSVGGSTAADGVVHAGEHTGYHYTAERLLDGWRIVVYHKLHAGSTSFHTAHLTNSSVLAAVSQVRKAETLQDKHEGRR